MGLDVDKQELENGRLHYSWIAKNLTKSRHDLFQPKSTRNHHNRGETDNVERMKWRPILWNYSKFGNGSRTCTHNCPLVLRRSCSLDIVAGWTGSCCISQGADLIHDCQRVRSRCTKRTERSIEGLEQGWTMRRSAAARSLRNRAVNSDIHILSYWLAVGF